MDSNPFAGGQGGDAFDPPNANPYASYAPDDSLPPAMEPESKRPAVARLEEGTGAVGLGGRGVRSAGGQTAQDLSDREAELARREAQLDAREQRNRQLGFREKNWPKFYPMTYHDIDDDIPTRHQALLRRFYALVFFTWLCLFFNWFVVVLVVPGAWKLWYHAIYIGTKVASSRKWVTFFVQFGAHLFFVLFCTVGPNGAAAAGLFFLVEMAAEGFKVGIAFAILSSSLWLLNALGSAYLLKQAHFQWKTDGHQNELQKDMAKAIITNQIDSSSV